MAKAVRYGVGEQSFQVLREDGFLYVDKTQFIEKIVNGSQYYFLGRPRRFGKSLFLSTLKCFFEGKRELFKGLHADSMDWDWEPYPVLHIALNMWDYSKPGMLTEAFDEHLRILDLLMTTDKYRYVMELKVDSTPEEALIQIDSKEYPLQFQTYQRCIIKIGANFSTESRRLSGWLIE